MAEKAVYVSGGNMKPSIGRIVIYKYHESEKGSHQNGAEVCPAVIVRVWTDTCVNLKLFEDGPVMNWKTSALLGADGGQWAWPERV